MKILKNKSFKDIINEIGEINIFRYYVPNLKINQVSLSVFRKENHPSFLVYEKEGKIKYKDFGSCNYKGDCIDLVCQLYSLNKHEAIIKIQEDFGLLKPNSSEELKKVINSLPIFKITKKKNAPDIVVATRSFTDEELGYWNDYYQDIEDLKREHIFAPKKIWINKVPLILKSTELTFCYYYPEIDKWKLYKPFAPKDRKWFTNIPFDHIENIDNIEGCQRVFIAKSKKDKMVLSKAIGSNCMITTQAEDLGCFNEHSIECLKNKEVFTLYDNDTKGKSASWVLTNNFGFKHCNVPDKYLKEEITDFADLAKNYSIEYVYNHFKKKNLI